MLYRERYLNDLKKRYGGIDAALIWQTFPNIGPFGVMDMVGNVWQWTDEFEDQHTRAAILHG